MNVEQIVKYIDDIIYRINPYKNEFACRITDPNIYDRIRRVNCFKKSDGKCIDYLFGIKDGISHVQALRYPIKFWNEADAKAHCKKNKGEFETIKKDTKIFDNW